MILRTITKPVDGPVEGDIRVETRFAWWPLTIDNKRIWLHRYQRLYEFRIRERSFLVYRLGLITGVGGDWDLIGEKVL